jgi:hypothetical protein
VWGSDGSLPDPAGYDGRDWCQRCGRAHANLRIVDVPLPEVRPDGATSVTPRLCPSCRKTVRETT